MIGSPNQDLLHDQEIVLNENELSIFNQEYTQNSWSQSDQSKDKELIRESIVSFNQNQKRNNFTNKNKKQKLKSSTYNYHKKNNSPKSKTTNKFKRQKKASQDNSGISFISIDWAK